MLLDIFIAVEKKPLKLIKTIYFKQHIMLSFGNSTGQKYFFLVFNRNFTCFKIKMTKFFTQICYVY